jgi:endonuclease/exonuclease/phosphatase family metal-dependent hydrolase
VQLWNAPGAASVHLRRRRTYPGVFPVLHLDHIYFEGEVEVTKLELPRTRVSLLASDHLPLVAELRVKFGGNGDQD